MSMYAEIYPKDRCPNIETACSEFTWDYLAEYIPHQLADYIKYHEFVKNILKHDIIIQETQDYFIFLSEFHFAELRL